MIPRHGDKRDVSYGPGDSATRRRFTTSSRRPVIRCTSPERAAGSGSRARRVVVPGPMVTSQSSNSARRTGPAWPVKVISYVLGCTRITPRNQQHHVRSACQAPGPASSPVDGWSGTLVPKASDRAARSIRSRKSPGYRLDRSCGETCGGREYDDCGCVTPAVRADEVPANNAARDAGHKIDAA